MIATLARRRVRRAGIFMLTLLLIEFVDEVVFGAVGTALPFIRADLNLTYAQIGLLLTIPALFATLIEPFFGILADVSRWRRRLMIGGGVFFVLATVMTALAGSYGVLMAAFMMFFPASGAFVSISQATLMDAEPHRHEQNMARWTLSGSLAVVVAPFILSGVILLGGSWRTAFLLISGLAGYALLMLFWQRRLISAGNANESESIGGVTGLFRGLVDAVLEVRRTDVLHWLILMPCANLMMDVLYAYLALYFVDVVGLDEGGAALGIAIWTGVGLLGDIALLPLLERVRGLSYLRVSAVINLLLYPLFLLSDNLVVKLIVLALLGFFNAGWYSVLQAQVYTALPGKSGAALALDNIFGILDDFLPLIVGIVASLAGLGAAMWLMLLGPIALIIGLPRRSGGIMAEMVDSEEHEGERV